MESELRALVLRYAVAVDDRDFDRLAMVFTPDAVLDTGRAVRSGLDEIRSAMEGLHRYESTDHRVGESAFRPEPDSDATRAAGVVACEAHHVGVVDSRHVDRVMVIEYQDSYVVTDAGWRIAARRLVLLREDVIDLQG